MPATYASRRPIGWGHTPNGWLTMNPSATFGGDYAHGTVTYPAPLAVDVVARFELAPVWTTPEDAVRFAIADQRPDGELFVLLVDEATGAIAHGVPRVEVGCTIARNLRRGMAHRVDVWGTIPQVALAAAVLSVLGVG
mgnify:FL=1